MAIVEVTGGVDTHADHHMAAAIDPNGGLLGIESFPATEAGYQDLLSWLVGFGDVVRVGVEGTGSWGVGLTRFLTGQGVVVVEVDRPNRQGPMDNGGHGKIGFTIEEGTSDDVIPSVRANTFNLPDGFFLVREHRGPVTAGEPGAYMPPCSGGISNAYYVTIKAVELVSIEEGTFNEIEDTVLELGRY